MSLPTALDLDAAPEAALASPLSEVASQPIELAAESVAPGLAEAVAAPVAVMAAPATTAPVAATSGAVAPFGTLSPSVPATWPMLGALLLVVGLILVLGKLVKRVQGARAGAGAALTVKGGVQIGAKERVVWMQAGETHLLLGVSPGRVQTLHVFDVAPDFNIGAAAETAALEAQNLGHAEAGAGLTPASQDFADRLKSLLAHARAKGVDTRAAEDIAQGAAAVAGKASAPSLTPATRRAEPTQAAASKPTFSFRA